MPVQHIKLSDTRREALRVWIDERLLDIENRLTQRKVLWRRWRDLYEGKVGAKAFPWKGASNVFVPVTAITVDAVHANMMNRLFGFDRVWDVGALHTKEMVGKDERTGQPLTWTDLAGSVQDFLAWLSSDNGPMQVYDTLEQHVLETIKIGTSIVYNPYVTLSRTQPKFDPESGDVIERVSETIFDGPRPQVVPLEDFRIMPAYSEIHGPLASPLVGHCYWLRDSFVKENEDEGWYIKGTAQPILDATGGEEEDVKDAQAALEGDSLSITAARINDRQLYDLWLDFDINDDGREEAVFISYHRPSGTLARVQPFIYKTRPYIATRYVRREHRFYGIGIPEMIDSMQSGLNTNLNQAIDNATLANVRGFKVRRNSFAAKNLEEYHPAKRIFFDNETDVTPFQLGEVYPSVFEVGRVLLNFMQMRTGMSDPPLGRDTGQRTPATSTMALLQETARRFDLYAKDMRRSMGELGMQTLELIQQFKPTGYMYAVMGEDAKLVEKTLTLPGSVSLREHLRVSTTSSIASSNKEIARQNALAGFSILSTYLDKLFSLGAMISNQQLPPPLKKLAYEMGEVGERLMTRVLDGFDLRDIATFLPQLESIYAASVATGPPAPPAITPGPVAAPGSLPNAAPGGGGPGPMGGGGFPTSAATQGANNRVGAPAVPAFLAGRRG